MITKITPETKLSEIVSTLEFMNSLQGTDFMRPCSLIINSDLSGRFINFSGSEICLIKELSSWIKKNMNPEKDYDAILSDPAAVKKILSKLPIKDILSEISGRFEI